MSGLVQGLREREKWCNMQPGYRQIGFEVATAADRIIELEALLGNAVGAIIDSGGYCEGPHDVAAAIYRLTAERDSLRAAIDELSEDHVPIWTSEAAKAAGKDPWVCQMCDVQDGSWPCTARMIIDDVRATGGAPGVSETHTDPKEEQQ